MHDLRFSFNLIRWAVNVVIACCGIVFFTPLAHAQKRVKLKHADVQKGGVKDGVRTDKFIGDVIFVQNNTTIYCDSAIFYRSKNSVDAFGKIRITEGDSVTVTSLGLTYDGNSKTAYLRRNVVFTKLGIATLYTDFLDYDRKKNEARYFNGGKLVDSTNTLTSKKGYYDIPTNVASFKKEVVGVNPDYTLHSDTLQYNSKTKVIYFRDHTTVKGVKDGETAVYENGFYDTNKKLSSLTKGEIETQSYKMNGQKYFLDDVKKFYKAKGKVVMTSKEENTIIYGDDGDYDKVKGIAKVYGNSYVAKVGDDLDTLFISADTLVSIENEDPKKKRLLAYNHVKIFRDDMQAKADSLAYTSVDSTIYFYSDPVLWTSGNQMTADSIKILLKGRSIDKIYLVANSFVISEDTLKNYNQIKGRKMVANFDGQAITHVTVQGNGESLYYALQEPEKEAKKDSTKAPVPTFTMGMNKIICSNMKINFKEGKVNNISFYIKPDASFIPPHELKDGDKRLKGFKWRTEERPEKEDVVKK
jgi:lipopolysaccharide export system protein LptA